jgi:hypothetical protein
MCKDPVVEAVWEYEAIKKSHVTKDSGGKKKG